MAVNALSVAFTASPNYPTPVGVLLWPQNLEFLFGCGAAVAYARVPAGRVSRPACLAVVAAGVVGFALSNRLPGWLHNLGAGAHALVYGLLSAGMVLAGTLHDKAGGAAAGVRRRAGYRAFLYLGDASYAVYLVHGPVLSAMLKAAEASGLTRSLGVPAACWLAIATAVAVGCLFHELVEKPILARVGRQSA